VGYTGIQDDRRLQMRRSLSIIAAAAIAVGASAVSLSPTQAAMPRPAPVATDSVGGAIIQVGNWESFHGDRHNAFRDDGWNNGWRHRRQHRFRHHGNFRRHQPFYFGFPFAFVQPYHRYNRRHDCFRNWEGYVVCR
jgi:hypothetical protein